MTNYQEEQMYRMRITFYSRLESVLLKTRGRKDTDKLLAGLKPIK